jgi:hypothetical protein
MRQFAAQKAIFEPSPEFTANVDSGRINFNQLLMLAIERALVPPVVHRRSIFQPMRIVVVDPALLAQASARGEIQFEAPKVLPRAAPPAVGFKDFRGAQFQQRLVRGEILSDESGWLYEKLGRQIRPIHQLASGQFGEVIDLVPIAPPATRMIPSSSSPGTLERSAPATTGPSQEVAATQNAGSGKPGVAPLAGPQTQPPQASSPGHRKLFADPGHWRVVWFGEFKEILAGQLNHPERLRDTYRLPCYVQVLEIERTISVEELAAVYKSDNEHQSRFYFLTDELAAKLDLMLPLRPAPARHTNREQNTLIAHERVFRLLAANDPTIDVTMSQNRRPSSGKTDSLAQPANDNNAAASSIPLKNEIPKHFVKEHEFKLAREEASYDMNAKPGFGSSIRKFCRSLRVLKRGNELRKWQTLLAGRTVDEQIWAIRPPAGTLGESVVREWARKTLELGGYDSQKMLNEWEIFWRRKGLWICP